MPRPVLIGLKAPLAARFAEPDCSPRAGVRPGRPPQRARGRVPPGRRLRVVRVHRRRGKRTDQITRFPGATHAGSRGFLFDRGSRRSWCRRVTFLCCFPFLFSFWMNEPAQVSGAPSFSSATELQFETTFRRGVFAYKYVKFCVTRTQTETDRGPLSTESSFLCLRKNEQREHSTKSDLSPGGSCRSMPAEAPDPPRPPGRPSLPPRCAPRVTVHTSTVHRPPALAPNPASCLEGRGARGSTDSSAGLERRLSAPSTCPAPAPAWHPLT